MATKYLIKRQKCKNDGCGKPVIRLVNDELCITCYQAKYYQNITKKKRKKKSSRKKDMPWYLSAYLFG